jgi:hypothetical protein
MYLQNIFGLIIKSMLAMSYLRLLKFIFVFVVVSVNAQNKLTTETLKKHTQYFTIESDFQFPETINKYLRNEANKNQFIGIAEVHQSEQLSYFTTALLKVLKSQDYNNFALEIGDYSASILEDISKTPSKTSENLKLYNKKYGKNKFPFIPFIFVDKNADARFIEEASKLNYNLWGIDREYEFSYLMHLDKLYQKSSQNDVITSAYQKAIETMKKVVFKDKVSGKSKYCWLLEEPTINNFFSLFSSNQDLKEYTIELQNSWKIYCKTIQRKGGSNARAKYMRAKFDSLYAVAAEKEKLPKVLVKLGGVHLTHGKSQYNRYDVGKHLHEKAKTNNTGFMAIRHVWRYKNGKDQIDKKGWDITRFLMQMGKKHQWTLIDLRPLRKLLNEEKIVTDKGTAWELKSYDWFLISPNDTKGKINR